MPDIFLSYSRDDQARAKLFAEAFVREGFDVWWDAGLRAGEAYDAVTERALREAKAAVASYLVDAGDLDGAMAELEKARDRHESAITWIKAWRHLSPLHSHPRWPALLRSVGLSDEQLALPVEQGYAGKDDDGGPRRAGLEEPVAILRRLDRPSARS